jgi:hypothetical protein
MFKPGTSVYKVNLYLPSSRLNGSVEVIALNWGAAERLAQETFFDPEAGWQVTGCERVRSIDEHVAEESYLG